MPVQERAGQVRLEPESVHGVGRAARQEQWISMEPERGHSSATMKNPTAAASDILRRIKLMGASSALIPGDVKWCRAIG